FVSLDPVDLPQREDDKADLGIGVELGNCAGNRRAADDLVLGTEQRGIFSIAYFTIVALKRLCDADVGGIADVDHALVVETLAYGLCIDEAETGDILSQCRGIVEHDEVGAGNILRQAGRKDMMQVPGTIEDSQ